MKFSEILKDLLLDNNSNAKKLAKEISIQDSTLYKYLKGTLPRVENAVKLANYFDCSLNYLFGIDENPNEINFSQEFNLNLFYPRYEYLLNKNHKTHYQVANTIDLNTSSLYAWKHGTVPYIDVLVKIAKYFSCSVDYLVGRKDSE